MYSDRSYSSRGRHPQPAVSAVSAVIWVTVACFILQWLSRDRFTLYTWLDGESIRHHEYWRLGSYMFVHGGFWHILMNMWGLHLFGRMIEDRLGSSHFLNLYFISGVIGGGTWLFFNWDSPVPVIGASGGLFGVMMAAAMLFPNERILLLIPPIPLRLKTFVGVYALVEVFSLGAQSGIAHLAHLGGLLGGFLYMHRVMPVISPRELFSRLRNRLRRRGWSLHPDSSAKPPPAGDADAGMPTSEEIDRVLDKIGEQGLNSLTPSERRILDKARERLRRS